MDGKLIKEEVVDFKRRKIRIYRINAGDGRQMFVLVILIVLYFDFCYNVSLF